MKINQVLYVYTDGGARGNPGPAAIGVVISKAHNEQDGSIITRFGRRVGETTNNVAEYRAVIAALEFIATQKLPCQRINFFLDSQLVVSQLTGEFKIKQPHLRTLVDSVHALVRRLGTEVSFTHVSRSRNKHADELVNQALDDPDMTASA
ncbi:TPA: ribonuclease H [Patescibacteria group bacterium]|uniref:Ribonuclease H n=1 Tax=Candidatus Gottesmanbacteria bacterium GW2011_GWA1_43_11 TaxID=1618436 RepID=A0A0G1CJA0_9BACT|nr:MAG: Ribonuclease H [Candidatus Gottesmanbacteria bacterium GW2011_GWA1_43_11]HCS79235.1 ribonuclease H [Patescibacteria group bacterium]